MEKLPKQNVRGKKASMDETSYSKMFKDKEKEEIKEIKEVKTDTVKKSKHTKNNSNVEEFAFGEKKQLDEQLTNFVSNYDDLISGIVSSSKDIKTGKNKSEGQLHPNMVKNKGTQSAVTTFTDVIKLDNLVTQVDEKFDIQNLTNIEEIKDYYEYTENCLQMISKIKMPDMNEIEHLLLDLPDKFLKKKLAIFDLDETLIHCELKQPQKAEKLITIKLPNGNKARIGLNIRPHIVPALEEIMKHYNMIIYTASDQSYADSVIGYIDPMKAYFKHRLYRHNCVKLNTENGLIYVKDLRIIKNIPLSNMIIIDNSVLSFAFHLNNGIPILPFYSNKDDIEMNFLKGYLIKLAKFDNITIQNGATFNLKAVMEEAVKSMNEDQEEETHEEKPIKSSTNLKSVETDKKNSISTSSSSKNNDKEKLNNTLNKTKKNENLEVEDKTVKPIRRKSKVQNKIFEALENAKR